MDLRDALLLMLSVKPPFPQASTKKKAAAAFANGRVMDLLPLVFMCLLERNISFSHLTFCHLLLKLGGRE